MGFKFSKSAYIYNSVFWFVMYAYIYRMILENICINLPDSAKSVYYVSCAVLLLIFTYISKNTRNVFSVITNVMLPLEIYSLLLFWDNLWIIFVLLLVGVIILFTKSFFNNKEHIRGQETAVNRHIHLCKSLVAIVLIVPMLISVLGNISNISDKVELSSKSTVSDLSEYTIANKADEIRGVFNDEFNGLNKEEKLKALKTLCDIECNHLGIKVINLKETNLNLEKFTSITTYGLYKYKTNTIYVDSSLLASAKKKEVINTVFHEVYHSYQHYMVNIYNGVSKEYRGLIAFKEAKIWDKEFKDYKKGEDDFNLYKAQAVENSSEEYAEKRYEKYRNTLHIEEQEETDDFRYSNFYY